MALKARVLTLSSLAHFINDGSGITYATVYPIFVLKHGFTYIDISIVSATYLVSSALMSLLIGRIADITGTLPAFRTRHWALVFSSYSSKRFSKYFWF